MPPLATSSVSHQCYVFILPWLSVTPFSLFIYIGIFISPLLVDTFQEPLIEATPENETAQAGGRVDFVSVLKQLGLTVLVPLVIGQIIQIMFTEKVAEIKVKWRLSDVSSVALLLMVYSVFCDAFYNRSFDAVSATDIIAVVIINAGLYILFSLLSLFLANIPFPSSIKAPGWVERLRYSREDTVAVMVSTCHLVHKKVLCSLSQLPVLRCHQNSGHGRPAHQRSL